MSESKKLSNPFSTGGGGAHFEAHVQASFVTLMLTGGHAPCLPCWPIKEIKLQGKIDGFETDDLIVFVENPSNKEQRKLLGQVKHSIAITQGSVPFREVIQAAWNDFNNPKIFNSDKDIIALITGPINKTDTHNVKWLLDQARHTKNVDEFFTNVQQANFSPSKSAEKLAVFQHHLKAANGGKEVSRNDLYHFLKHFHLLGYDLGDEYGVALSLLHSHISQFHPVDPQRVWAQIVDFVQIANQNAGTITPDNLPDDLLEAFKRIPVVEMPEEFKGAQEEPQTVWAQHPDATYLALAVLIGAWNEEGQDDRNAITQLLGISYEEWLKKAREILHCPGSPLSLNNGIWKVVNRSELWSLLGSRILDHDLDKFKSLAISTLSEPDPAFELPPEERHAASIHGKVLKCSQALRKGISEGLAILGSNPDACGNCSPGEAKATCKLVLWAILSDADWVLWGSLDSLLPALAEAAPDEFLDAVETALSLKPCPFDELFAQEGSGITGRNYLTGLLWALEGLAWDKQYLVRVCVVLGELASHDPGGQWVNRPSNSLATILLPWFPQTLAPVDKRKVAVKTLLNEWPVIAWNLILQLLPGQHETSSGSHKPNWRKTIPDDWEESVTTQEYRQQVSFFGKLAVGSAGHDIERLTALIDRFDNLPQPAFDQLVEVLNSRQVTELPEEQRQSLWDHLTKFTKIHRRFSDAKWALSSEVVSEIESVATKLAPTNLLNLKRMLFSGHDLDLYEETGNWKEQQKKLEEKRQQAIRDILSSGGMEEIIQFAKDVESPLQVGNSLSVAGKAEIDEWIFPAMLATEDRKLVEFTGSYVWSRRYNYGWDWVDGLDRSGWSDLHMAQFLSYLPFVEESWRRAEAWLGKFEKEYWRITNANPYDTNDDIGFAIGKLIENGRPKAAIHCLSKQVRSKQVIDKDQAVRALLFAGNSIEPLGSLDKYGLIEIIKALQHDPETNPEDLSTVELAYLPLLNRYIDEDASPKTLENRLASDPAFFCEAIGLSYRSKKEPKPKRERSERDKAIAQNAGKLLWKWRTPPGTQPDSTFLPDRLRQWLEQVKEKCAESGHLEVALIHIGQVLFHCPPDPDELWIHHTVAEVLNDKSAAKMREGFRSAVLNSRGAHFVDPTGKPERKLAIQYRQKAEDVENAGFQRFAVTLRGIGDFYDQEAKRIIAENKQEDQ